MLLPLYDENPTRRWPIVTAAILVLNVLAFFYTASRDEHQQRVIAATHGFTPNRLKQVFDEQAVVRIDLYPEDREARPDDQRRFLVLSSHPGDVLRSLFTSLFLHADLLHLAGNMWFLLIFSNNIEDRLGHVVYLFFYLIGGVLASLAHSLAVSAPGMGDRPLIGASGAVAVMLGAYIVSYPTARVRCLLFLLIFITLVDLPAWIVLAFWFGGQFLEMQMNPELPVAYWAHIGGFAAGVAIMPLLTIGAAEPLRPEPLDRRSPWGHPPSQS